MAAKPPSNDEATFAGMVREHQAMVFSLALHFLGQRDRAEDLAQDVFIQLYQHLDRIQSPSHLRFWLRRVTVHRCIDHARRAAGERWLSLDEAPEPSSESPPADPLLAARLQRVLASLPAKARMMVVLRYQEELEPQEIAAVMEMPLNTVKSSLQRALALLRAKLARPAAEVRL